MLRHKQHSRKEWPPLSPDDLRVPVLLELLDSFDMHSFVLDPDYRHRLNEVLDAFSDEEFDRFERRYASRFTLN